MRPFSLLAMVILLFLSSSVAAEVIVTAPAGGVDPAFLAELKASIEEVAAAEAPPESARAELEASANAVPEGVALEVTLVPADGFEEIRESRVASRASALSQARAMARSVVRSYAERLRAGTGPEPSPESIAIEARPEPTPIDLARTAARPGIVLGFGLDVAGFLGLVVTLIVFETDTDHIDRARVAACVSGGAIALGSLVSTTSYTMRHVAYRRAGLMPRPYKASVSWVLTTATLTLYALAVAATVEHARSEPGSDADLSEGIGWAMEGGMIAYVFAASIAFEVFNAGLARPFWHRQLRRSEKTTAVSVAFTPFMAPSGSRSARPVTGLAAVVQF